MNDAPTNMHIHYLQHVPFEDPAAILTWAQTRRHTVTRTCFFKNNPLPSHATFDALVIMGGPMSVHDEKAYSWLAKEKHFIEKAIAKGKRVLGICLGAQLIAHVLGARVKKNRYREIGWFPVTLTKKAMGSSVLFHDIPQVFPAFHWHGETFDIPDNALRIGRTAACRNQGFVYNENVLALQFHIESTPESIQALAENCGIELVPGPFIKRSDDLKRNALARTRACNAILYRILDTWAIL
jgi:GMP synthase-like glutamine amidotransferase